MAGCDFSTRKYTYNDKADDFLLTSFSLADEDVNYKVKQFIFKYKFNDLFVEMFFL